MARKVVFGADSAIELIGRKVPKIYNQELNRGFKGIIADFAKTFDRQRLRGGSGLRVRRDKDLRRKKFGSQPRVPKKTRALGFKATLSPVKKIANKVASFRTSSPLMKIFEFGGPPIRPKKGKFLFVKVRKRKFERGLKGFKKGRKQKLPYPVRVRSVTIKPRLGFYRTWGAYRGEALKRLKKIPERVTARANVIRQKREDATSS